MSGLRAMGVGREGAGVVSGSGTGGGEVRAGVEGIAEVTGVGSGGRISCSSACVWKGIEEREIQGTNRVGGMPLAHWSTPEEPCALDDHFVLLKSETAGRDLISNEVHTIWGVWYQFQNLHAWLKPGTPTMRV